MILQSRIVSKVIIILNFFGTFEKFFDPVWCPPHNMEPWTWKPKIGGNKIYGGKTCCYLMLINGLGPHFKLIWKTLIYLMIFHFIFVKLHGMSLVEPKSIENEILKVLIWEKLIYRLSQNMTICFGDYKSFSLSHR